jgi:GT2 family glycosyltransferase
MSDSILVGTYDPLSLVNLTWGSTTKQRNVSCGGAMMVRTEIFQKLGGFDTTFDPFGTEP